MLKVLLLSFHHHPLWSTIVLTWWYIHLMHLSFIQKIPSFKSLYALLIRNYFDSLYRISKFLALCFRVSASAFSPSFSSMAANISKCSWADSCMRSGLKAKTDFPQFPPSHRLKIISYRVSKGDCL